MLIAEAQGGPSYKICDAPQGQPKERHFIALDVDALYRELESSVSVRHESIVSEYLGKWLHVTGRVAELEKVNSILVLWIDKMYGNRPSLCGVFKDPWQASVSHLKKTETVRFIGRIGAIKSETIRLDDCETVKP